MAKEDLDLWKLSRSNGLSVEPKCSPLPHTLLDRYDERSRGSPQSRTSLASQCGDITMLEKGEMSILSYEVAHPRTLSINEEVDPGVASEWSVWLENEIFMMGSSHMATLHHTRPSSTKETTCTTFCHPRSGSRDLEEYAASEAIQPAAATRSHSNLGHRLCFFYRHCLGMRPGQASRRNYLWPAALILATRSQQ